MKATNQLLPLLLLLCLFACEKSNETDPLLKEKVLTRKELRTSYGHVSFDSLEYEGGKLNRIIHYSGGTYSYEFIFFYDKDTLQIVRKDSRGLASDPNQKLVFDPDQRLKKLFYESTGVWEYQYENADRYPSTSSGSINATFIFDASANLIHHEYLTPWGIYEHVYEYDDKVNPQRDLPYFEFDFLYFSENNITGYKFYRDGILEYETALEYGYDDENYPIKMILGRDTTLFSYSYIDTGK